MHPAQFAWPVFDCHTKARPLLYDRRQRTCFSKLATSQTSRSSGINRSRSVQVRSIQGIAISHGADMSIGAAPFCALSACLATYLPHTVPFQGMHIAFWFPSATALQQGVQ